ncbi:MAG: transcriptional regulator CysB [Betaproteobacteria bacterium RIFCSPLOWO2_12_FULL_62_13]|nr:MAG: transcriptional regulator CysB [Betaproteobacteria bacterium RIFCSPLOWO2_12_FULL_62_13]
MNLRQLTALCEVVDRGLRISDAAHATFRAQSSVTRQIQLLESELGFELFVRNRNKLLRITPQGEEILRIARRMLQDAENMRRIGRNLADDEEGEFTIATTHTHARYVLPRVIAEFVRKYPKVRLSLRQGNPVQCCELVARGKADLAICTDPRDLPGELAQIPCYRLQRSIITPRRHPLLRVKPLTLEALAGYPLITYDEAFSGRHVVDKTFSDRDLHPRIVLSAADADVSKVYVGMGLGIAIFASVVFDPKQDVNLRRIDARHLFKPSSLNLVVRRYSYLRTYMVDFIQMFAPRIDKESIDEALFKKSTAPAARMTLPDL